MQALRAKQIGSLFQYNPGVREIVRDSQYEVTCPTSSATLQLRVFLPPTFPQVPPTIQVQPPVRHPWVNEHMQVTGCERLRSWRIHSDLGQAVQDIIRQFEQFPPAVHHGYPGYPGQGMPPPQPQQPGPPPQPSAQPGPSGSPWAEQIGLDPLPDAFPEVDRLSFSELTALNEDKAKLFDFVQKLDFVKMLNEKEAELRTSIESLAQENLDREPDLTAARQRLQEKHKALAEKRAEFDELVAQQQELSKRYAPESILDSLRIATHTAEEEAEAVVSDFHGGKMTIDRFLEDFIAKKKLHHVRKAKEEQLARSLQMR